MGCMPSKRKKGGAVKGVKQQEIYAPIKRNSVSKAPVIPLVAADGHNTTDAIQEQHIQDAYETGHLSNEEIRERIELGECPHTLSVSTFGQQLGMNVAWVSQRGFYPDDLEKENQDSFLIDLDFNGEEGKALFGIFDGHGKVGDSCSRFARDKIGPILASQFEYKTNFEKAYIKAFVETNTLMHKQKQYGSGFDDTMSGTTGITVFIHNQHIYVGNVGDSRAIICCESTVGKKNYFALSLDQTPFRKDERERCKRAGAAVMTMDQIDGLKDPDVEDWGTEEEDEGDPPRLWVPGKRYPGTAFTRSLGDSIAEQVGVFAEPEVLVKKLTKEDKYIIIASDGVFEFLSNENVLELVNALEDPSTIARRLVAESYRLWLQYEVRTDDITCIVIKLNGLTESCEEFQDTIISSFLDGGEGSSKRENSSSFRQAARPVRRGVAKAKKLEINSGDRSKLTTEEMNYSAPTSFEGTPEEKAMIENAVRANFLFQHLQNKQREAVFNSMKKVFVNRDDLLIKQGDMGDKFYIVEAGIFDVIVNNRVKDADGNEKITPVVVHTYNVKGDNCASFGELALMYDKPRAATVKAKSEGVLWALDRVAFRSILLKSKSGDLIKTLSKVQVLSTLDRNQLTRLADTLSEECYKAGDYIIRQGEVGDTFHVISTGEVAVTKFNEMEGAEETVMSLSDNSYFGERALLSGDRRAANVKAKTDVTCFTIGRKHFEEVLGPLQLLIDADRIRRELLADNKLRSKRARDELGMLEFKSDSFEPFATILEESLAHMNLVRYKGDDRNVYSLYSLCKNSVYADKKMKQVSDHLHRIFKLSQYSRYIPEVLGTLTNSGSLQLVYKTVLVCPLPELWSGNTLAKLNEFEAKFYVSCLICALETIHTKGMTFRGMSSEKILIDHVGMPQLTDYKISKDNISRSFTICGTPDYMAPEVITNSGADYTVDWWAIGVLLHELMTGSLPFSNEKTTEFQLFEKISNYKHLGLKISGINQDCVDLIHAFLNPDSKVRLGHGGVEYGVARIKEMEWFKDVSWERIAAGREPSPHIEKVYNVLQDMKNGSTEISATHPEYTIDDVNWFKDW